MAKKTRRKKSTRLPAKFSLKSLHAQFDRTRARLNRYDATAAQKKLGQDLDNAQAMMLCGQGMLRDLSK